MSGCFKVIKRVIIRKKIVLFNVHLRKPEVVTLQKMAEVAWWLFHFLTISGLSDAYKMLAIFPIPAKSHSILGNGVVRHLLKAGHEVTLVTAYVNKNPTPNLREIDVSSVIEVVPESLSINAFMDKQMDLRDPTTLFNMMHVYAVKTLQDENVQKLLKDPKEHFDVVITEWMFTELLFGVSAIYNVPHIIISTLEPHWVILSLIDEALNPAYNGDCFSSNLSPFTFKQRLEELWNQIRISFYRNYIINDMVKKEYDRLIAPIILSLGRQPPSYDQLKYNASLILGNSHVSMGLPTRLPQSYKPIGGYHIEDVVKPLPEDLKKIIDSSKHGVIYFSMGSVLRSKDMPDEVKKNMLKMFGELKQTVLWKFEETLPGLPENVHIFQWVPQQSILAHPNCVLFITHGGLLSTTESIHFGVPVIGIPIYGDQFINIDRAKMKGYAKRVELSYAMAVELKVAIHEVLNDSSYAEKAKELSLIYHDRVASPGAELVHWVEHVVRTRGAPHLRSPALLVPWYQKMYLDLIALIIIVLIVFTITLKRIYFIIYSSKVDTKKKTL